MKFPFFSLLKNSDPPAKNPPPPSPWPWPPCATVKTLSFRQDNPFRTFNSAFLAPESSFSYSSQSNSFSSTSATDGGGGGGGGGGDDPVEIMVRGLRSERLFFEPERSSSLVIEEEEEEEKEKEKSWVKTASYKESVVLTMESNDPYWDYRKSMEEMVEAHELKDWERLEELLSCYLKINSKKNHGFIICAFIDLLINFSFLSPLSSSTSSSSTNNNNKSPSSPLSLPSSSVDHGDDEIDHFSP